MSSIEEIKVLKNQFFSISITSLSFHTNRLRSYFSVAHPIPNSALAFADFISCNSLCDLRLTQILLILQFLQHLPVFYEHFPIVFRKVFSNSTSCPLKKKKLASLLLLFLLFDVSPHPRVSTFLRNSLKAGMSHIPYFNSSLHPVNYICKKHSVFIEKQKQWTCEWGDIRWGCYVDFSLETVN